MDLLRRRLIGSGLLAATSTTTGLAGSPLPRSTGRTPPRAFPIEKPLPWLAKYRRKAVRLHPVKSTAPLPPEASKLGGNILWPAKEAWPYCRERDLHAVVALPAFDEYLVKHQEMKLAITLAPRMPPPPKPNLRDIQAAMEEQQAWNHQLQAQLDAAKAKGMPKLTSKELEEARVSYRQMKEVNAKMALPHNTPYVAIAQLRREDFPELPWPPARDLMQLLWCPRVHFEGNGMRDPDQRPRQNAGFLLKWRSEKAIGPHLDKNPVITNEFPQLTECCFQPEEIVEYPQSTEFHGDLQPHLEAARSWFEKYPSREDYAELLSARYDYDLSAAPGTKLGGYPFWMQGDDTPECTACGAPMLLIFSCATLEHEVKSWQVPAPGRSAGLNPLGMDWGDGGTAYLFSCKRCGPGQIRSVVQSS